MITSSKQKVSQRLTSYENTRRKHHDVEVGKDCGKGHAVLRQTTEALLEPLQWTSRTPTWASVADNKSVAKWKSCTWGAANDP